MKIHGKPVVDAKRRTTITITSKDIQRGNNKDPGGCAAALAIIRERHVKAARVHLGRTYILKGGKWVRYNTPDSVRSEIISFDRGATFQPGTYTFRPVQPSHRGIGKRQGSGKDKRKKNAKPRAKPHVVYGVRQHGANR